MEKEYLLNKSNEITLNVTDGKVDSYREKDETQSTVRVYDNGTIGVAGALGDCNFDALEKRAQAEAAKIWVILSKFKQIHNLAQKDKECATMFCITQTNRTAQNF